MSYLLSISFILVVIYLLFKNPQYTLPFDKIIPKIIIYEVLLTILVALINYSLETPLSYLISSNSLYGLAIQNLFFVAPLEELGKFLAVYLATDHLKSLRQKEDLVLYLIFSACIFSGIENILYVFIYDQDVLLALLRNFISTPCHLFYSMVLGCCYTLYLKKMTNLPQYFLIGFVSSSFLHGMMNFFLCLYSYTNSLIGIFFAFISICTFYILGFIFMKKHLEKALIYFVITCLEKSIKGSTSL